MDGTLPEEPGQPALSPRDVEPTSETVRSKDLRRPGFLSSQKRTMRFYRFWDQSARPYVRTCCRGWHLPIKFSPPLALPMHFHEAPASTAVRNASSNYSHCHRPEARYPVMTNGNGGGLIIQEPSGPGMLHGEDDRQSRTDDDYHHQQSSVLTLDPQQQAEVLTLVSIVI